MIVSEEITSQICNVVPGITPKVLDSIFTVAGKDSQLLFVQGEGHQVIDEKSRYPDYLQIEIGNAQEAMALAQQLLNACSAAIGNGGVLPSPVTLLIAGQAIISE
ncbi:conserved hypothetical protein [Pseudomonas veronii]|uniref:hypothetical protein n=1 Tax=Pseudomonas veronii TaxID=76761 RepID=UPI001769C80F|nr:hypothetical protein [Pseudomonas veronii]CAD0266042.1 conserved hypothetical protein [Pseudomonas veronii]